MIFVVGGRAQGKLSYVLHTFGYGEEQVSDGETCSLEGMEDGPVLNRFHLLVARLLREERDPAAWVDSWLARWPQGVVLADEIGGGVVPMDGFERRWREESGRLCCVLAKRAMRVDRVCCGIPSTIKEGKPC